MTHLKSEFIVQNPHTNTDNVLTINFIIGWFTLIFKLTEL